MDKFCDRCGKDLKKSWVTWGDKKQGEKHYCIKCDYMLIWEMTGGLNCARDDSE